MQRDGMYGRQGSGARAHAMPMAIRSTLPKGELAYIPPGVEGIACATSSSTL